MRAGAHEALEAPVGVHGWGKDSAYRVACAAVTVVGQRASTSLRAPLLVCAGLLGRARDVAATQQMSGGLFESARCVVNLRGLRPMTGDIALFFRMH